jgi:hypothetical protein
MTIDTLYNIVVSSPGGLSTSPLSHGIDGAMIRELEDARLVYVTRSMTGIMLPGESCRAERLTMRRRV